MRSLWLLLWMAYPAIPAEPAPAAESKPPAQAARGQATFFDEANATHCGTCHALKGKGTAVGPDLARLARLSPRAIAMAIQATRTQYVQAVKLKDGTEFPGMPVAHDESTVQFYDVGAKPPALRKVERKDVGSISDNANWKHFPESEGYTARQLADVIAYIKWASYGDTKAVSPNDVE
jgi:putative heme-binding domain-containing protein